MRQLKKMANCFPSPNSTFKAMHVSRLLLLLTIISAFLIQSYEMSTANYTSIYSFGDSWADTGNTYYLFKSRNITSGCSKLPYGEDFIGNSTGRCSNGRLIIDFIAEHLGLPSITSYFGIQLGNLTETNIEEGVNFAIAGATALPPSFFQERAIPSPGGYYLRDQLDWFNSLLPSMCASPSNIILPGEELSSMTDQDCSDVFRNSLFLMGEIGGNDYLFAIAARRTREELTLTFVPQVINATISAVKELINLGAVTILVPGTVPIGCNSIILTIYEGSDPEEYDEFGCLEWLNKFSKHHNQELEYELKNLQKLFPHVNIFYGDYYDILSKLVHAPTKYGLADGLVPLIACCGGGGPYNWNRSLSCGNEGATVCANPSQYIYWDGAHLTEAAFGWIAKSLLSDEPFTTMF